MYKKIVLLTLITVLIFGGIGYGIYTHSDDLNVKTTLNRAMNEGMEIPIAGNQSNASQSEASQITTVNWIGFEVGSSTEITYISETLYVPVLGSSYFLYDSAYTPDFSSWIGLSAVEGGSNSFFMQTGINSEAYPNYQYSWSVLWGNLGQGYYSFSVNPGDSVFLSIKFTGSQYDYYVHDLTTGQIGGQTYFSSQPSYYAQWEAETPLFNSQYIAQTPVFSSFTASNLYATVGGCNYSLQYMWNNFPSYRQWLSQYPDVSNANDAFSNNVITWTWSSCEYSSEWIWLETGGQILNFLLYFIFFFPFLK